MRCHTPNAPYRRAIARLARGLLALQEAADEVLALDPGGYEPEDWERHGYRRRDESWSVAREEGELLRLVLRRAAQSLDCVLCGGLEGHIEDVEAEELGGCGPCVVAGGRP